MNTLHVPGMNFYSNNCSCQWMGWNIGFAKGMMPTMQEWDYLRDCDKKEYPALEHSHGQHDSITHSTKENE